MKKLLTIIAAIAAITINAQAKLTPKEFAQLRDWAAARGYFLRRKSEQF
jgi:hypothetical protein